MICPFCGREINNIGSCHAHINVCRSNPNRKDCVRIIENGKNRTIIRSELADHSNAILGWLKKGGQVAHNRGKMHIHKDNEDKFIEAYELEQFLNKGWSRGISDKIRAAYAEGLDKRKNAGRADTKEGEIERRRKISESMKKNPKAGGRREGSGYGHKGWYKGIFCDSSWELAFVAYKLDHNEYIERCKERRSYIWQNEQHVYIPDFVTDEGVIEIKGYKTDRWLAKLQQNPDVKVLYERDMKPYLDYVVNKYGKDLINIYEKKFIRKDLQDRSM